MGGLCWWRCAGRLYHCLRKPKRHQLVLEIGDPQVEVGVHELQEPVSEQLQLPHSRAEIFGFVLVPPDLGQRPLHLALQFAHTGVHHLHIAIRFVSSSVSFSKFSCSRCTLVRETP